MFIINHLKNILGEYNTNRTILNKFPSLVIERNVQFKGPINNLFLGENCTIQSNCVFHLGGMEWCDNLGLLKIGDNAIISPFSVFYGVGKGGIVIGNNFDCGPGVKIFSSKTQINDLSKHDFLPVIIGDNVTLFANVVISPGSNIGNNCVIGANSVVTGHIDHNSLAYGVPAKVIKRILRNENTSSI